MDELTGLKHAGYADKQKFQKPTRINKLTLISTHSDQRTGLKPDPHGQINKQTGLETHTGKKKKKRDTREPAFNPTDIDK